MNTEITVIYVFQASKDVANFYASWDLAEVSTTINLVSLVCHETGLGMDALVRLCSSTNISYYILILGCWILEM